MRITRRRTALPALLAATALALGACATNDADPGPDAQEAEASDAADPDDVVVLDEMPEGGVGPIGDPESYIGVQVTALGQVGEVYSVTSFEFIGEAGLGTILVASSADADWEVSEGDRVQVVGTIMERFDAVALGVNEDELAGLADQEGVPYLEAEAVEIQTS